MIRRNSIGHQAATRMFISLGLLVAFIAISSVGIYQMALQKAAHKRADELVSFYTARLDQIEREWEIRSRDFKVRIEVMRALEDPESAVSNLQAFMTIQGSDRPFQYLLIQTEDGRKLFDFGKDFVLSAIPASVKGEMGHYQEPKDGQIYRVFVHPIWLGEKFGMGRFAVFFRIDNALLRMMSTPGLTLSILHDGKPIASSGGQEAIEHLARNPARGGSDTEIRQLPWTGNAGDSVQLRIEAPVTTLFSTAELSVGMSMIPLVDGLVLWFTIGLWLMRQTRRINCLGSAVGEYASAQRITPTMVGTLASARQGQTDEIAEVADAVKMFVDTIDQRERERGASAEQLRISEQRFRLLFNNSGDAIFVSELLPGGLFGRFTEVNDIACQYLGYSHAELLQMGPGDIEAPDHGSVHDHEFFLKFQESRHALFERVYIAKDGRHNPVEVSVHLFDLEGRDTVLAVARDITERKLAEQSLRESYEKLDERVQERTKDLARANAALSEEKSRQEALIKKLGEAQNQLLQSEKMATIGQLAAGVAHEINNPVGFVNSNVGSLERYLKDVFRILDAYELAESVSGSHGKECDQVKLLKEELDYAFIKEDVFTLIHETLDGLARVRKIVQDLKDFSHVDEAEWQWANLHNGLDSTLNVVNNEIKYKAEVIKAYGDISEVECLPSQLNQVFMNMLVNAAHAIAERGTITVRTGREGDEVWVEISDTGNGIAPENLKRVFDPFFTTKPIGKGTGLGLSLSYGIVQNHHGRIDVRSEQGKGTTFRIILPVQQPKPEEEVDGQ